MDLLGLTRARKIHLEASLFVKTVEHHQGYKVACLEEIGLNNHWITKQALDANLQGSSNNGYTVLAGTVIKPAGTQGIEIVVIS